MGKLRIERCFEDTADCVEAKIDKLCRLHLR